LGAELAAARLRASEGRFRQLADTIPQLAWMARPDGWTYWYNSRWYEYTGATSVEMEGWGWQTVHDPAVLPRVLERWRGCLASGEPFQMEFPLRGADGSYRAFLTQAVPLRDAKGDVVQWFGTNTDVTSQHRMMEERQELLAAERVARNEAERVSQMKDEFVATLSHELRTPLNAILGWTQLLAHTHGTGVDLKEGLATIERNARVQVQMIEDLLDVSRITSGKLLLQPQRVGFCSIVEGAIALGASGRGRQGDPHPAAARRARGRDPRRPQPAAAGRLEPAHERGQVHGQGRAHRRAADARRVAGRAERQRQRHRYHGRVPAARVRALPPGRRLDHARVRRPGLGLSIVKQLVELHGGSIQARSAGRSTGATFIVSLPLSSERAGLLARGEESVRASELSATLLVGLTVVYIDDDPDAGELVRRVLTDRGARVFVGKSAVEARQLIVQERPHVMVTDIGMPGEDGYSLIRSVRAMSDEQVSKTPAAAVTALARTEDRQRALLAGFQTHVAKPVEPNELVAVVASLAGARAPARMRCRTWPKPTAGTARRRVLLRDPGLVPEEIVRGRAQRRRRAVDRAQEGLEVGEFLRRERRGDRARAQRVAREDLGQGLRRAVVQVGRVVGDAQERGTLKPTPPRAGAPEVAPWPRSSSGSAATKVPTDSRKRSVCVPCVKDTICGPALVRPGSSTTPPAAGSWSKVGLLS
jgi:PAS domain S-box-containing protein